MNIQKSGFTLMEVTITVIILGVLASLAIPRLSNSVEHARTGEALHILDSLLTAQRAFFFENNAFESATCNAAGCGNLDVSIPTSSNFDPPTVDDDPIATVTRTGNLYTLSIDEEGVITCNDLNAADTITCALIGCTGGGGRCN